MKLAFLATISLAALSLARPVDDEVSVSATAVTTPAAATVTTSAVSTDPESTTDFSTAALTASLAETSVYAWIDLGWVNGITSGSLTKFMGITYATAKLVSPSYQRKTYTKDTFQLN
jgi:hypothetical protein